MRIGYGFDIHQLAEGRKLILGGMEIPFEKGLLGHSDADVLLHAITDALLGALALGDIGQHFPDTDPEHKDADSRALLKYCYELVKERGYHLSNLDATIVAERPKLMPHLSQIRKIIATDLQVDLNQVSVKATTSEKMGFVGREEGISATAVVLIEKR
ncbi:MAG: 2-C-methyl-D-erythritol 2,4-cyclodiphosphate synthase [Balneolaceae bacterium]|nr:2-C-methyl-D-erythritol 2,4-cyclodiphosphate synthase [Balneolaceae bacterium]MBO6545964.1 2-C-methyl-D-erythritol 2,4-cyclodiphosphate synthase [Balneolaceae bacterium]MBO6647360.1 2-C-methyl-D-erythritol 2,4-cyclodiphosphate synthase [Balneolaceae bacterium]